MVAWLNLISYPEQKTFSFSLSRRFERTSVPHPAYSEGVEKPHGARLQRIGLGRHGKGRDSGFSRRAAGIAGRTVLAEWPRPVLPTIVASSVRSVGKLWIGVPSSWHRRAIFALAAAERSVGATGSWAALAAWSS